MPQEFAIRTTELAESRAELWQPLRLEPGDLTGMGGNLHVVGSLAPRGTLEQAQTELTAIAGRIEEQFPSYSRDWRVQGLVASIASGKMLAGVLYGVTPADPLPWCLPRCSRYWWAMLAAYLPTRRALHVDALEALKGDS